MHFSGGISIGGGKNLKPDTPVRYLKSYRKCGQGSSQAFFRSASIVGHSSDVDVAVSIIAFLSSSSSLFSLPVTFWQSSFFESAVFGPAAVVCFH